MEADPDRCLAIIDVPPYEAFGVMRDFVASLGQRAEAAVLSRALAGPKPFRRFKHHLSDDTGKRWYAFRDAALRRMAEEWRGQEGIGPESTWRGEPIARVGQS